MPLLFLNSCLVVDNSRTTPCGLTNTVTPSFSRVLFPNSSSLSSSNSFWGTHAMVGGSSWIIARRFGEQKDRRWKPPHLRRKVVWYVWGISSPRRSSDGRKSFNIHGNFVLFPYTFGGRFSKVPVREQLCSHVSVWSPQTVTQSRQSAREDTMYLPPLWSVTVSVR